MGKQQEQRTRAEARAFAEEFIYTPFMVGVDIHEAQARWDELLERVHQGEEVTITKDGMPIARLIGLEQTGQARQPGRLAGRLHYGDDQDADAEIERLFLGSDPFPPEAS
jgi:prevent-host-death family protein